MCVCVHDTDKSTRGDRKNGCAVTPSVTRIGLASRVIRRLRCGVCDLGTELAPLVCFRVRVGSNGMVEADLGMVRRALKLDQIQLGCIEKYLNLTARVRDGNLEVFQL